MFRSALCLLAVAVCFAATSGDSGHTQSAYLDVQEKFYIEWQYTDDNITILARVKTTGWFGIGFSPNGGMAGADIITAGVVNDKPFLQDRYADQNGFPSVDSSQDVQLLSGSEVNGETTIKFTRKHNTCDDKDMPIGTDTMRVIYAISPDGSDSLKYHTPYNRGTRSIYLRHGIAVKTNIPDDSFTYDITVDNIAIPAFHTLYHCEVKRAPKLDGKHHLIKVDALIQKENLGLVHHIIVYGCFDNINRDHYFEKNATGYKCYNANMPNDIDACRAPVTVWAIGGGSTYYPEEAGFPIGTDESPDYFMMEIHYDNPKLLSGIRDSSGMRLTLTKTLRQFDAGILPAGMIHGIVVPPGVKDFKTSGFCTKDCTNEVMKENATIFGAVLHAHLAARQIIARQFRDGKELRVIDEDRHYDFNYQQTKMFEKPLDFLPGDEIMITCHYNTEERNYTTYGGLPSLSEMCISFIHYYPAQNVGDCYTAPGWAANPRVAKSFVDNNLNYPTNNGNFNVVKMFDRISAEDKWSTTRVKSLEAGHLDFPQYVTCVDKARNNKFGWFRRRYSPAPVAGTPPPKRDYELECSNTTPKQPDSVVG